MSDPERDTNPGFVSGLGTSEPALLIYIPTYNRPLALRRQLDALSAQRGDWPGTIRVLVSDNASPKWPNGEAQTLAAEYGIEVRRNGANIHGNANIALGFVFARREEYLWILSDDDTVGGGALKAIACEGLSGDPDAIALDSRVAEPATTVREWREGWSVVGEANLISNVIYKVASFADQSPQAFYYHNTSFPHLAVILATLRERGSLSIRVLPRGQVFLPQVLHQEEGGDYSLSLSGMPQLALLLSHDEARRFCRLWLHDQGNGFIRYRSFHPEAHLASRAVLIRFLGIEGRIRLLWLAMRAPLAEVAPEPLKRWLRRLRGRPTLQ